jgi:hypothetical protein
VELGDFNGDGMVDETENRLFAGLKRQVELGDGGRLETILDRQLSRFTLTTNQLVEVRAVFREGKRKLYAQTHAADLELQSRLQTLLGPERFARYQDLMIRGVQRGMPRSAPGTLAQEVRKQLLAFDRSGDGRFDRSEAAELAKTLDGLPGGFGRAPASLADRSEFQRRLLAYYAADGQQSIDCNRLPERMQGLVAAGDSDHNGVLTLSEIETYVRQTAFRETVDIGIYVGGGFGDAFVETAPVLAELELPGETREAAQALLAEHARRLETLNAQAVGEILRRFVAVTRKKSGSTPG